MHLVRAIAMTIIASHSVLHAQVRDVRGRIVDLVADEMHTQLTLAGLADATFRGPYKPHIAVIEGGNIPMGKLWRTRSSDTFHWHQYTVVQVGNELIRLGGFSAPELLRYASLLHRDFHFSSDSATALASLFGRLVEPNGPLVLTVQEFRAANSSSHLLDSLAARRIKSWPPDTTWTRPDGSRVLTITMFARDPDPESGTGWDFAGYAFLFNKNGQLLSWSSRR